jgi:hypothetical protein
MRVAALVPTRNRARTAVRAIVTFLAALKATGFSAHATVIVADDSDDPREIQTLLTLLPEIREQFAWASLYALPATKAEGLGAFSGGPGAVRNRGLDWLRRNANDAERTFLFDDDVCFSSATYRGMQLECDGAGLLRTAIEVCAQPMGRRLRLVRLSRQLLAAMESTMSRPAGSRLLSCHSPDRLVAFRTSPSIIMRTISGSTA